MKTKTRKIKKKTTFVGMLGKLLMLAFHLTLITAIVGFMFFPDESRQFVNDVKVRVTEMVSGESAEPTETEPATAAVVPSPEQPTPAAEAEDTETEEVTAVEEEPAVEAVAAATEPAPEPEPEPVEFADLADEQLPSTTRLKEDVTFKIANGAGETVAVAGSEVEIVGRNGDSLLVRFLDGQKQVSPDVTTLMADVNGGAASAAN